MHGAGDSSSLRDVPSLPTLRKDESPALGMCCSMMHVMLTSHQQHEVRYGTLLCAPFIVQYCCLCVEKIMFGLCLPMCACVAIEAQGCTQAYMLVYLCGPVTIPARHHPCCGPNGPVTTPARHHPCYGPHGPITTPARHHPCCGPNGPVPTPARQQSAGVAARHASVSQVQWSHLVLDQSECQALMV